MKRLIGRKSSLFLHQSERCTHVCALVLLCGLLHLQGLAGHENCGEENVYRLCGMDYSTAGACITLVDKAMDWHAADEHCKQLPYSGFLVWIMDQQMQDFVAQEVEKKGWEETWINGCLKYRLWIWQRHWDYLAYQGCYRDNPNNPDLPIVASTNITKPTQCIRACQQEGSKYASIQMKDNKTRVECRCSFMGQWHRKYELSHDAECDSQCEGGLTADSPIDRYCGGTDRQIVYHTEGTLFQAWAPHQKRFEAECVSLDDTNNHFWVERNCADKIGHICEYDIHQKDKCNSGRGNIWIVDVCISLHNENLDYYQAQMECSRFEGALMQITSAEQFQELRQHLDAKTPYYFALTHEAWIFSNWQLVYRYFNWGKYQPATGQDQDCFKMKASDNYKWYNVDCNSRKPFVCLSVICTPDSTTTKMTSPGSTSYTTFKAPSLLPPTTAPGKMDEEHRGGTDLYKGIGIGMAIMLAVILMVIAIFICVRRLRNKPAAGGDAEEKRALPPHDVTRRNLPAVPNPSFEPDIINHESSSTTNMRPPATTPVAGGPSPGGNNPSAAVEPTYQGMGAEYDHTYDHIRKSRIAEAGVEGVEPPDEDYVQPIDPDYPDYQQMT